MRSSLYTLIVLLMIGLVGIVIYGGKVQASPGDNAQSNAPKVTTTVHVSKDVTAHRLTVRLLARVDNAHAVTAQKRVAGEVSQALKALPKGVHASTAGYQINQRHPKNQPASWQVSESLELHGANTGKLLAAAHAAASSGLIIAAIDYSVGSQERHKVEMHLTQIAVRRWRQKAAAMAHALGCKEIHPVHVSTRNRHPQPEVHIMAAQRAQNSAPPARETISVTVTGTARAVDCH